MICGNNLIWIHRCMTCRYFLAGTWGLPVDDPHSWRAISFTTSYTLPQSATSDNDLDDVVIRLCQHFRRACVTMLGGMLQCLGYRISREHISQSLVQIDPVQWVFQRIQILQRVYSIPGSNSLWHHDGQHGMCQWHILLMLLYLVML